MPPLITESSISPGNLLGIQTRHHRTVGLLHSGNVGQKNQRVGFAGYGACRGHLVGVHVVILAVAAERDRRKHRECRLRPRSPGASVARKNKSRRRIPDRVPHPASCARGRRRRLRRKDRSPADRRQQIAATRLLFTMPASTIKATSRVSASVTRSPLTKSLFLPSSFKVRVSALPPPCTTATWCPS